VRRRDLSENFPFARAVGSRNEIVSRSFPFWPRPGNWVESHHKHSRLRKHRSALLDFPAIFRIYRPQANSFSALRNWPVTWPAPVILRPTRHSNSCSQNDHRISRTRGKTGHHRVPNALKRKDRPSLDCAHNPKVGGSNPSPAIQRRLNKPPFFFGLQTYSSIFKSPQRK